MKQITNIENKNDNSVAQRYLFVAAKMEKTNNDLCSGAYAFKDLIDFIMCVYSI